MHTKNEEPVKKRLDEPHGDLEVKPLTTPKPYVSNKAMGFHGNRTLPPRIDTKRRAAIPNPESFSNQISRRMRNTNKANRKAATL